MNTFGVLGALVFSLLSGPFVYADQATNTCYDTNGNSLEVVHGKINHATLKIVKISPSDDGAILGSYSLAFQEDQEKDTGILPFNIKTAAGLNLLGALSFGAGDWTMFSSTHVSIIVGAGDQEGFTPLFSANMTCKPGHL